MNKTKKKLQHKLELLSAELGFDSPIDLLLEHEFSSNSPSICINDECDLIHYQNPLESKGICEDCGTKSVMSCQMIQDKMQE